ncbi:MAG: DUF721 domain-containing protein, partial [Candidatus Kapaibacterium sp.]
SVARTAYTFTNLRPLMHSDARPIGFLLQSFLKERGLQDVAIEARVPEAWRQVVGENAAKHCSSVTYAARTLTVQVDSSVWRTELRYRKNDIMRKINEHVAASIVDDIILR